MHTMEEREMTQRPVVVIGAGPAGLASAAELRRRGVPVIVLERAEAVAATGFVDGETLELLADSAA